MSKRNNIAYIKPQDPSFLAKLKSEIGYKEGPTVDTKRQRFNEEGAAVEDYDSSEEQLEERPDRADELPQVVVLGAGDLTAEQAEQEQARIAKEEATAPADLNQRVIFQKKSTQPKKSKDDDKNSNSNSNSKNKDSSSSSKKTKKAPITSSKLSFNDEDEEDEEQE